MNGAFLSEFRDIGTTPTRIRFGKTRTGTGHTWEYYQEKFQAYHTDGGYAEKNASSYVTVEKNKEEGCRKGRHYPVRLIANGRWIFILLVPRDPVLPHYAAGSRWTTAWRIAMIMLRNTVQSNILAHLLFKFV
jgi:hypothetical protein